MRPIEPLESRLFLSADPVPRPGYNTGTGFFVTGGKVYDANGYEFIMKGLNHNQWWGNATNNLNAIDHVARTGANAVRAVFNYTDPSSGSNTPAKRRTIVERYLANNIVPVVEDHSTTTSALHEDPAALAAVVDQWLLPDNVSWLQQYESKIILNIANEWGPNSTVWRDTYITQVQRLRNAGINALIMLDAGGWGQEINTIKSWGQAVLDADPQHNIVFSIHFYSQWRTEERNFDVGGSTYDVRTQLMAVQNLGLPIFVGEFSWEGNDTSPHRTRRVLEICDELGIGYMGWAWSENNPATLNMLPGSNWQYNTNADLTIFGDQLINDPDYGIKATAVRATVFPPAPPRFVLERTSVSVPEDGMASVHVRLSSPPASNVTVTIAKMSGGDGDLSVGGVTSLLFTPVNWDEYQPVLVAAGVDADAANGSARIQLSSAGMLPVDFLARENDAQLNIGPGAEIATPDRDNASGTATTSSVTSSNALSMKFSLAAWGGRPVSATLRVYKNTVTSGRVGRAWFSYNDAWTESSAVPYRALPVASVVMPNAVGYVDFDVTSVVTAEMLRDGVLTLSITTNSGSGTTFFTRESAANKPTLVINTVEAIPPAAPIASFQPGNHPHQLWFQFFEDVSASISSDDLALRSLSAPALPVGVASHSWNAAALTATFSTNPPVLPDGWYEARLKRQGVTDANGNPLVADAVHVFPFMLGDIADANLRIDIADFSVLASNFNQSAPLAGGDLTYDGSVTIADFAILASKFNTSLPALRPAVLGESVGRGVEAFGGAGRIAAELLA